MKRNPEKETTIWLPRYVYDEIRRIADENQRSIMGELRYRSKIKKQNNKNLTPTKTDKQDETLPAT